MKSVNIVLDEELMSKALQLTGLNTQNAVVNYALRELVRSGLQKQLLQLKGKVHWQGNLKQSR